MRLAGLLFIAILPPAVRTATAPAATPSAVATAPLLSLNVPNPLNALGLGLGNLGAMVNTGFATGMPFGNVFGFGHMLGHFHNYNNLFYNQLLLHGLFGMAILKIMAVVIALTVLIAGGFLVKLVGLALVLAVFKVNHQHNHYSHHPYRRAFYTSSISHDRRPWPLKAGNDDLMLWEE